MASGTDVMPGRAIRPMFMSIPGSFSYFFGDTQVFSKYYCEKSDDIQEKAKASWAFLLVFRTLASRQLL